MTDPLETLHWHESERERTDSQVIAQGRRFQLVEKRPAPLDLTEAEQLEFLAEYCSGMQYVAATNDTPQTYIVWSDWFETTRGRTLSDAICLAAAKWKGVNQ
jgi:hypothetical protein